MNQNDCGAQVYIPNWQDRINRVLFPYRYTELPEMDGAKDGLHCGVKVDFSFIDRLRILFSGKVEVTIKTTTENVIGKHVTNTGVSVRPPDFLTRK